MIFPQQLYKDIFIIWFYNILFNNSFNINLFIISKSWKIYPDIENLEIFIPILFFFCNLYLIIIYN